MRKDLSLKCFSPAVMLATFFIEIGLAIYTIWRYGLTKVSRLAVLILVCLAVFQFAEYNVCEGALGLDSLSWSRVGYVAITLLPPLGLHLAMTLADEKRKKKNIATFIAYASAAIFVLLFAFSSWSITSQACLGNYVIFQTTPHTTTLFAIYYYGWLLVGTIYAWLTAKSLVRHKAVALRALSVGYLSFLLPTTTANIIDPATIHGIPSIMCGFAVLLAIIIVGEVLPQYHQQRSLIRLCFSKDKSKR